MAVAVAVGALAVLGLGAMAVAAPAQARETRAPAPRSAGARETLLTLEYVVKDMSADSVLNVTYDSGVVSGAGGDARAVTGGIRTVDFLNDAFVLSALSGTALDGEVNDDLFVTTPTITGTADIPAGATVTLTNADTGQRIDLKSGRFSLPTGTSGVGAPPPGSTGVTFSPLLAPDRLITSPASAGQPVELAPRSGVAGQFWKLTNPGNPSVTQIISEQTGLCLAASAAVRGATVVAATCDGSKSQQWAEAGQTNGSWRLYDEAAPLPELALTVSIGSADLVLEPVTSTETNLFDWLEESS
jgi:hypothetical protein